VKTVTAFKPGTDVMIFEAFMPKKMKQIQEILTLIRDNHPDKQIFTLIFKKKRQLFLQNFSENRPK
jgi:hypothetical protein